MPVRPPVPSPSAEPVPSGAERPQQRAARGHFLVEAMIASAVLLLAIAGVATAVRTASREASIAGDEQLALTIAEGELEKLRVKPYDSTAWDAGTYGPTPAPGHPGWNVTTTISHTGEPPTGPPLKRAQVTVDYRGRSVTLEALKW